MFEIRYSKQSSKSLARVPRNLAKRIRDRIRMLAADPFVAHRGVTKLQGREGYRVRVRDWRVLYVLHEQAKVMLIVTVGPRGQVYK